MDNSKAGTRGVKKKIVKAAPVLLLSAAFIVLTSVIFAIAASNINSSPQFLLSISDSSGNITTSSVNIGISPQNADNNYDTVTVSYSLASQAYSNLKIYSNASSTIPVRDMMTNSPQASGNRDVVWNGKDNSGTFAYDSNYVTRYDGVSYRRDIAGFSTPSQVWVDSTKRHPQTKVVGAFPVIYVADTANNRISWSVDNGDTWNQITNANTNPAITFAAPQSVSSVYVDASGNTPSGYEAKGYPTDTVVIWVTDKSAHGAGNASPRLFALQWNSGTSVWDQITTPYNMNTTAAGGSPQAQRNNLNGAPYQITIDPQGTVYIPLESIGRVRKWYFDEINNAWTMGGSGFGFTNPKSVVAETTGIIYVSDSTGGGTVWKSIDGANTFSAFLGFGTSDGQVSAPQGLHVGNSRLWVADTGNNRIQQFYTDSKFIQKIQGAGDYSLNAPRGVAVNSDDELFVSNTGANVVKKYIRDNILGPSVSIDNTEPEGASVSSIDSSSTDPLKIYHRGTLTISASAFDSGSGVQKVEFWRTTDINPIATDYVSGDGWGTIWDTSLGLDDGSHGIYVKVFDFANNVKTSATTPVIVDNFSPVAGITSPAAGSYKRAVVPIVGTASDTTSFDNYVVEHQESGTTSWSEINNSTNGKTNDTLGSWDTTGKNGLYTVRVSVSDKTGSTASYSVNFTVDNTPPNNVTTGNASNNPFSPGASPGVKDDTTINLTADDNNGLDGTTSWTLTFKNQAGSVVRTYTGTGSPASRTWNGKYDDDVTVVPDGQYNYVYEVTDKAGNTTSTAPKYIDVDNTGPSASIGAASPDPFSPNADGTKDTTNLGVISSSDSSGITSWSINIYDKDDLIIPVRTLSGAGNPNGTNQVWDGKDDLAGALPDDTYRYKLTVTDNAGNSTTTGLNDVVLDTAGPVASVSDATNDPFSPNADGTKDTTSVDLTSSDSSGISDWELKFTNTVSAAITKTFSGAGDPNGTTKTWSGDKDGGGNAIDGTYSYELNVTDNAGNETTSAQKTVKLDLTLPSVSIGSASPDPFSPNADGTKDTTNLGVISSSDSSGITSWNIKIYDKDNLSVPVRTITGAGNPNGNNEVWDGKNDAAVVVPDDTYKYKITVTDGSGNQNSTDNSNSVVVDNTGPVTAITSPSSGAYSSPTANVVGTASDTNFEDYILEYGSGGSPSSWATVSYSTSAVSNSTLGTLPGLTDGQYTARVTAEDKAGTTSAASQTFYVDSTDPTAVLDALPASVYGVVDLRGIATDSYFDRYELQWGMGVKGVNDASGWNIITDAYSEVTGPSGLLESWDTSSAPSGQVTVRLSVYDLANKVSRTTRLTVIDNTYPTAEITDPATDAYKNPNAQVIGTANDTYFKDYTLDYRTINPTSGWSTIVYSTTAVSNNPLGNLPGSLTDGKHEVRLQVTDNALTTSVSKVFHIDSQNPYAQLDDLPAAVNGIVNLTGVATDSYSFDRYELQWGVGNKDVNASSGWNSITEAYSEVTGPSGQLEVWDTSTAVTGLVTVRLSVHDNAGKVSRTKITTTIDNTNPDTSISSPAASSYASPTAQIMGTAKDAYFSDYILEYGSGPSPGAWTTITTSSFSINNNGLLGTLPGLADGQYTARVTASDTGGLTSAASQTFYVDSANPTAALDALPTEATQTQVLTGIADDYYFDSYKLEYGAGTRTGDETTGWTQITESFSSVPGPLSGTLGTWNTTGLPVGVYTVRLTVNDEAGKSSKSVSATYVDGNPPVVDQQQPTPDGYVNTDSPLLRAKVYETLGESGVVTSSVSMQLDSTTVAATYDTTTALLSYQSSGLSEGSHEVRVDAEDVAQNHGISTWAFTVDITIPSASITVPTLNEEVSGNVDIYGTSDDLNYEKLILDFGQGSAPTSWTEITTSSNNYPAESLLGSWDTTGLEYDGPYTIRLRAFDLAGNITEVQRLVKVKNQYIRSQITYPVAGAMIKGSFPVIGTAENSNASQFFKYMLQYQQTANADGTQFASPSWVTAYTGGTSVKNSTLGKISPGTKSGYFNIRLITYDKTGDLAYHKISVDLDNAKPTLTGNYPTGIVQNESTIGLIATDNFSGIEAGTSSVKMTVNGQPANASYDTTSYQVTYSPQGPGDPGYNSSNPAVIASGFYKVEVEVTDKAGNSVQKNWSFTQDTDLPVAELFYPLDSSTVSNSHNIAVIGSAYDPDNNLKNWKLEYKKSTDTKWITIYPFSGIANTTPVLGGTLGILSKQSAGQYDLKLTVTDKVGSSFFSQISVNIDSTSTVDNAEIAYPADGTPLKGAVPLKGRADLASSFAKYEVVVRQLSPTTSSFTTSYTTPVRDEGTLYNWNTGSKNGTFQLELRVLDTTAAGADPVATDMVDDLKVDNTKPKILGPYSPTANGYTNNPTAAISVSGVYDPNPLTATDISTSSSSIKIDGIPVDNISYDPDTFTLSTGELSTPLSEGKHKVDLKVSDVAGNSVESSWSFTVDSQPPVAVISKPPTSSIETFSGSVPIVGQASDSNFSRFYLERFDVGRNSWMVFKTLTTPEDVTDSALATWSTGSLNGPQYFRLRVADKAGNESVYPPDATGDNYSAAVGIFLDNIAPVIANTSPAAKAFASGNSSKTLQLQGVRDLDKAGSMASASGIDGKRTELTINNIAVVSTYESSPSDRIVYTPSPGEPWYKTGGGFEDGTYDVTAVVYDKAGKFAKKSWSFTVDNTAPLAELITESAYKASSKANINGKAYDKNIKSYVLKQRLASPEAAPGNIKGGSTSVGTETIRGTLGQWSVPPVQGRYELTLSVEDRAGNKASVGPTYVQVNSSGTTLTDGLEIAYPLPDMSVKGSVGILGKANTTSSFSKYEVAVKKSSGSWSTILASYVPVAEGTLATWNTGKLVGTYDIRVKLFGSSTTETTIYGVIVDNTKPVVASISGSPFGRADFPNYLTTSTPTLSVKYTQDHSGIDTSSFDLLLDGTPKTLDFSGSGNASMNGVTLSYTPEFLKEGVHTIKVSAKDKAGNLSSASSWKFYIDTNSQDVYTAPTASISKPVQGSYAKGSIPIVGSAYDPSLYNYSVIWQSQSGTTAAISTKTAATLDALLASWNTTSNTATKNGEFELMLTLTDRAGWMLTDSVSVVTDNVSPVAAIAKIGSQTASYVSYVSGTVSVEGTAYDYGGKGYVSTTSDTDPDDSLDKYVLDYGAGSTPLSWATINEGATGITTAANLGNWATSQLTDGIYTLRLRTIDKAGAVTQTKKTLMVDNTSPYVGLTSLPGWVKGGTGDSIQVDGKVDDGNLSSWKLEYIGQDIPTTGIISQGTARKSPTQSLGAWSTASSLFEHGTKWTLKLSATDKVGNTGFVEQPDIRIDRLDPQISNNYPTTTVAYDPGGTQVGALLTDDGSGIDTSSIVFKRRNINSSAFVTVAHSYDEATGTVSYSETQTGSFEVSVTAKDLVGRVLSVFKWVFAIE